MLLHHNTVWFALLSIHYHVYKSLPLFPPLSQINPIHAPVQFEYDLYPILKHHLPLFTLQFERLGFTLI